MFTKQFVFEIKHLGRDHNFPQIIRLGRCHCHGTGPRLPWAEVTGIGLALVFRHD